MMLDMANGIDSCRCSCTSSEVAKPKMRDCCRRIVNWLLLASLLLAGCSPKSDVSVPSQDLARKSTPLVAEHHLQLEIPFGGVGSGSLECKAGAVVQMDVQIPAVPADSDISSVVVEFEQDGPNGVRVIGNSGAALAVMAGSTATSGVILRVPDGDGRWELVLRDQTGAEIGRTAVGIRHNE
jgi:hypothetical protein